MLLLSSSVQIRPCHTNDPRISISNLSHDRTSTQSGTSSTADCSSLNFCNANSICLVRPPTDQLASDVPGCATGRANTMLSSVARKTMSLTEVLSQWNIQSKKRVYNSSKQTCMRLFAARSRRWMREERHCPALCSVFVVRKVSWSSISSVSFQHNWILS